MMKKKFKRKPKVLKYLIFIIILGLTVTIIFYYRTTAYNEEQRLNEIKEERQLKYNTCMNIPYKDETIDTLFLELINSLNSNNVAIYFEDINNEYTFTLNENRTFYGASLIKLFMSAYLIDNQRLGNINLEDTLTYTSYYRAYAGDLLNNHSIGDEISLSTLITYSISISDNGAYQMLIDYISRDTLEEYAQNTLGINLNINGETPYANLTVTDTNTLLKHVYEIIQVNDEYSSLLKDSMNNTYYNGLNFDNITFLHKYGYYNSYYNDIGIYNTNTPYLISIFTLYGNSDNKFTLMSNISKQIYEIYQTNIEAKENYCYNLAYTEKDGA